MKRMLIGLMTWLVMSIGFAAASMMTVPVKATQAHFTVRLPANPTTGYQWSVVSYNQQLFTLTGSHYEAMKTGRIGSGGVMVFDFTCKAKQARPARAKLVFAYVRSWEKQAVKTRQVDVVFQQR